MRFFPLRMQLGIPMTGTIFYSKRNWKTISRITSPVFLYSHNVTCTCPESLRVGLPGRRIDTYGSAKGPSGGTYTPTGYKCVPMVTEGWKQPGNDRVMVWRPSGGGNYSYALKDHAILVCKYGGVIGVIEVNKDGIEGAGDELVTMAQMSSFGFSITTAELKKLNDLLIIYDLTDKNSIALFMATCGHESGKGTIVLEKGDEAYFKSNGYSGDTRGAGYLQTTGDDQLEFYTYINKTPPTNRAKDIADNYAWEAAIWEWSKCRKGSGIMMNNYVEAYGGGENIFLVTQYFVNSYLDKTHYPHFDSDMSSIRKGTSYSYNYNQTWANYEGKVFTGVLKINGRTYRLPLNYADRLDNYNEAMKIFK